MTESQLKFENKIIVGLNIPVTIRKKPLKSDKTRNYEYTDNTAIRNVSADFFGISSPILTNPWKYGVAVKESK